MPLHGADGSSASLDGHISNYNNYFLNNHQIQQNRYELHLKQIAKMGDLSTVVAGRFRADAALADHKAAVRRDADRDVRRDEGTESELRQAYLDYLLGPMRLKFGRQLVDWVDSLTPYASDVITPMDVRHGGFGTTEQVLVPVDAISVSHPAPGGQLEWMAVANPRPHRLPKGPNGFGYYEAIQKLFGGKDVTVNDEGISRQANEMEGGARYVAYALGLDLSLVAWHGHERLPILKVSSQTTTAVELQQTYAQVNTYGGSLTFSVDAFVGRALMFFEPRRRLQSFNPAINNPKSEVELYGQRSRYGVGIDATFSKHFKFYSESWANQVRTIENAEVADPAQEHVKTDYTFALRGTNETFTDFLLTAEAVISSPKHSSIWTPSVQWTATTNSRISVGWRMISSDNPGSSYESMKDADQVWTSLEYYF